MLVDAGYLLGGGGKLTVGTAIRSGLACDHQALINSLVEFAEEHSDEQLLRVYWYDGAKEAIPTNEHHVIGSLDKVKVRLGRLTWSGQKGVDSRIVRDIMTLARNRAISTAYLLSGDEDLREGVADAQEAGVRVILLGIPGVTEKARNQAQSLIRESDEHVVLDKDFWAKHITLRDDLITVEVDEQFIDEHSHGDVLEKIGELVAKEWTQGSESEEIYELAGRHPHIPKELDTDLLIAAQLADHRTFSKKMRKRLRAGFWDEILSTVTFLDAETLEQTED